MLRQWRGMDKHAIGSLLLLTFLAAINAPTHTSAASLDDRLHPPPPSYYEDVGDYFSDAEEPEPPSVAKRAPWAPTEIRYDAFVQKLLAGKNKLSGSRDKHSAGGRTDQAFQRAGRSSVDDVSDQQLDEISKIVKDLDKEIDEIQVAVRNMKSSNIQRQFEIADSRDESPAKYDQVKETPAEGESKNLEDLLREANDIVRELSSRHGRHPRAIEESNSRQYQQPQDGNSETAQIGELLPRGLIKSSAAAVALKSSVQSDASGRYIQSESDTGARSGRITQSKSDSGATAEFWSRAIQAGSENEQFPLRVHSYLQRAREPSHVGRLGYHSDDDKSLGERLQRQGIAHVKPAERDFTKSSVVGPDIG